MIKDRVKIHDKYTVEIKSIFDSLIDKRKAEYNVITYLFIPNGLNVNKFNYPKTKFYNDIKFNIRYNTPKYYFNEILEIPFERLKKATYDLIEKEDKKNKYRKNFIIQAKLFGVILNKSISKEFRKVRKRKENGHNNFEYLIEETKKIVKEFRDFLKETENSNLKEKEKKLLLFVDEYISNIVEYRFSVIYNYLNKKKPYFDTKDLKQRIVELVKYEQDYRKTKNYQTTVEENNVENLLYIRSELKKFIESVLFLNKDLRKDGTVIEQTVFALVAGIAMVFSTSVAFYYQQKYGNFTLPFFIALVLSYMLKDRIKGFVGLIFVSKAHSMFNDYKIKIFNSENDKIGLIKENFTFVPDEKIGPKIRRIRMKTKAFDVDSKIFNESVIQYKKKVVLHPKRFAKKAMDNNINSIADITRINLYRFTQQMDDPDKDYSIVQDDKIIKKEGERVYHLNIIQKLYSERGITFKRYRVIFNREGIKRIEKIDLPKDINVVK